MSGRHGVDGVCHRANRASENPCLVTSSKIAGPFGLVEDDVTSRMPGPDRAGLMRVEWSLKKPGGDNAKKPRWVRRSVELCVPDLDLRCLPRGRRRPTTWNSPRAEHPALTMGPVSIAERS